MEVYNGNYCVYIHINKVDGKIYAGQTSQRPEKRWKSGYGYVKSPYFWRAIQKYGWDNFEHEIVASQLTKEEADNFEKLLINKLDLLNPERGYNLKEGGHYASMLEETKQKLRQSNSGGNHPMYGKHLSDETKKKISQAHTGENNNFYGKHHSNDTKKKIGEANYGVNSHKSKKVYQYDRQGSLLKEWDNMTRVAEFYNVGRTTVMNHCRNGKLFKNEFILRLEKL